MATCLPQLLTAQDVAMWLSLPTSRVVRLARQKQIPCIVLPTGDTLFDPRELSKWLSSIAESQKPQAGKQEVSCA